MRIKKKNLDKLIKENSYQEKFQAISNYLDDTFVRADKNVMGAQGPELRQYCLWKDGNGQPLDTQLLSDRDLFYITQDKFQDILADKDERDRFVIQSLKNWYHKTNKW